MVLSFFLLLFFVSLVGLNIGWVLANRFVFIFGVYYLCTYEDRLRFGIAKSEIKFPFVSALTFRYLCWYEDRLRFGIAKSETRFPFVSALTFRYLCIKCRAVSWYNCGNFLYDRDCLCKKK